MKLHIWFVSTLTALPLWPASLPSSRPEEVGMSSERLQRIHAMIQRRIDAKDISGAVTLVARRGRVAHFEAQGLMDIEANKPMGKDAIFRIASMSKPVTGIAIMMLVEEGRVRLGDPISRYIPEFKGQKVAVEQSGGTASDPQYYTVPAEREITVRDLLTHVSGLGSGTVSTSEMRRLKQPWKSSLAEYVPQLGKTPLEFQPGSKWMYSPLAAFDTLGRVVEVASGMTFDQFLRQRLFDPLGMKDIFFYPPDDRMPRLVKNYAKTDGVLKERENPNFLSSKTYFSGGGGLMSTAEDYLPFGQMLVNHGQLNGKRILGPRTVDTIAAPHTSETLPGRTPGVSFGLSMRFITDHVAAVSPLSDGSFGWSGAFGTHFWVDPKEQIVAVLMIQTPNNEIQRDFENAVMQAIVE